MFAKTNRWIFVSMIPLLMALAVILSLPAQASAQTAGTSDNTCLTCHEDLYYLHDSGKLCCITTHADHCAGCHEGNPTSMKKEESHLGLLLHPQENGGAKCLECHKSEDVPIRMINFEADGGLDEVIQPEAYLPCEKTEAGFPEVREVNTLITNWKWLVGAFFAFGLWLVLVFFSPLKP
ncbi:hypothetical protein ANAEL_04060 [Anaerolineales bacterium]|nr:hypothetical protein ANAEL_04060 [Anaerolineales bacterium]